MLYFSWGLYSIVIIHTKANVTIIISISDAVRKTIKKLYKVINVRALPLSYLSYLQLQTLIIFHALNN